MKERPILFNGDMVNAIMDGRKTQTRRVIKPQPDIGNQDDSLMPGAWLNGFIDVKCLYGASGDRLWVREAINRTSVNGIPSFEYIADGGLRPIPTLEAMQQAKKWKRDYKSSMFMPRWASRITLEVQAVRVERVQDISATDAMDEGCNAGAAFPLDIFRTLWDSINGKPRKDGTDISWAANPWVWVVEFELINK